jgi:hypothetical protein
MKDQPRVLLCELISTHGQEIIDNPVQFKNMLKDYYHGEFKKEHKCLTYAIEEKIPALLQERKQQLPYDILSGHLILRLTDIGYTVDLSKWCVDSWAIALNIITEAESQQSNNRAEMVQVLSYPIQTGYPPPASPASSEINTLPMDLSKIKAAYMPSQQMEVQSTVWSSIPEMNNKLDKQVATISRAESTERELYGMKKGNDLFTRLFRRFK